MTTAPAPSPGPTVDPVEQVRAEGLSLGAAVAVGINTTSPAYSLAAILAPMALLVGYSTPVVLLVSFVPMALTSLAFMYLNRRDPDCGTTFSWVSRALGAKPGFLAGWVIAACGILVLGSLAQTAIEYGLLTIGQNELAANRAVVLTGAALLILVMVALSVFGADWFGRFQTVISFVQIGLLLAFAGVAAVLAVREGLPPFSAEWINPLDHGAEAMVAAMLLGVFSFWGWEAATNLSEECRRPTDAGKAGTIATVVLLLTYLLVATVVVIYLGRSDFYEVGESGLVLVDMSGVVFGSFAFLVLFAVFLSAFASTQTTMVPGSRAVLSMARRGALPASLGLMHPRYKTPWMSLAILGGVAVTWYVGVSLISESAMLDTLSSLGLLVAAYYSLTGIACIVYYRRHVVASVKGLVLVGIGPLIGSIGLGAMLVIGIRSLWDASQSASGSAWLGLAPPITIAALFVLLGVVVMLLRMRAAPTFFRTRTQRANAMQSPFILPSERPIPMGGVLIDCNHSVHAILAAIEVADLAGLPADTPFYLVSGVEPPEHAGVELEAVRNALIDDASRTFVLVQRHLKALGYPRTIPLYEEVRAGDSVQDAVARTDAARVIAPHLV